MSRLVWILPGRKSPKTHFRMMWLTCEKAKWAGVWQNQHNDLCPQRRLRSAWASAQSDQCLCCAYMWTLPDHQGGSLKWALKFLLKHTTVYQNFKISLIWIKNFPIYFLHFWKTSLKWKENLPDALLLLITCMAVCIMGSQGLGASLCGEQRLIRLGECPSWSESSLCAQVILLVLLSLISSQSLNLGGRRGTTDDVATIPFHPSLSSQFLRKVWRNIFIWKVTEWQNHRMTEGQGKSSIAPTFSKRAINKAD